LSEPEINGDRAFGSTDIPIFKLRKNCGIQKLNALL
jgi:hypothetical protein